MIRYLNSDQIEEIRRCRSDIVYFVSNYCRLRTAEGKIEKWHPYEYQKRLWDKLSANQSVIVNKSRQLGCSWAAVAFALWKAMFTPNVEILFLSQTERKAIRLLEILKFILSDIPEYMIPEIKQNTQTRISFSFVRTVGGRDVEYVSTIDSLTGSARTAASYTPTFVIMDEAAHLTDSEGTFAALRPAISRGGVIAIISTPNGTNNFFYRLWIQSQRELSNGKVPAFYPIAAYWRDCGFDEKWYASVTEGMTKVQILQEFELQFITSGTPFFDIDKLEKCYMPKEKYPQIIDSTGRNILVKTDMSFTGVDTSDGKGNDYTSIVTLNEYGVQIDAFHSNTTPIEDFVGYTAVSHHGKKIEIRGILAEWHEKYPGGMVIERWGTGDLALAKQSENLPRDEKSYVVGIRQSQARKQKILNKLRLAVAGRQIIITDPFTYECMRVFEDKGDGKYEAPNGFYDDPVIAIALAYNELEKHGSLSIDLEVDKKKEEAADDPYTLEGFLADSRIGLSERVVDDIDLSEYYDTEGVTW